MQLSPFCIGICGVARSGKDTMVKCIESLFPQLQCSQIALAQPLKEDMDGFLKARFGISAYTNNPEEKAIIRPLLVEYGRLKRTITKGAYFTNLAQQKVNDCWLNNKIPIISDIRYAQYENDEAQFIKRNNGFLIHVTRINENGQEVKAPNKDERENNPKLKKLAHIKIKWPTLEKVDELIKWLKDNQFDVIIKERIDAYGV